MMVLHLLGEQKCFLLFPFLLQKPALALNHFPLSFSMETAKGTVRGNNPVAWHFGSKGIAPECLSHGLSATASYASCQFAVGNGFSTWHVQEFQIHTPLEWGDVRGVKYPMPYVHVLAHASGRYDEGGVVRWHGALGQGEFHALHHYHLSG